ncbi:transglutaminase domain-containing protein [Aquipuribacter hungaricus]|uniref:Transglutaminase domain-containing protein n=1 Tax=Aquipuribacter hungaricus TaxID=545624 RepID=A0ABV7WFU8_9MICO
MTSRALTPWASRAGRRRSATAPADDGCPGSTDATRILDHTSAEVRSLLRDCTGSTARDDVAGVLRVAHGLVAQRIRPVYAVDEAQPVSRTLRSGRGSCSQRLAVLEAVARAVDVPTRSRGLLLDGRFWYLRFPGLRAVVPDEVVLAWPEFRVDGVWLDSSALLGAPDLHSDSGGRFTNVGEETLFEAVGRGAVRWDEVPGPTTDGHDQPQVGCSTCSLAGWVLAELGRYGSRDELFAAHGQTLCWPARTAAEPVLSRWSAGATAS